MTIKDKFEPIIVEVSYEEKVQQFFFYKEMVDKFPKILSSLKDNVWKISEYPPKTIQILLSDICTIHTGGLFISKRDTEDLMYLYKISIDYSMDPLKGSYESSLRVSNLNPGVVKFLIKNNFEELILIMYLNMDPHMIGPVLIGEFSDDIWIKIVTSPKLYSLELCYKYVLCVMKLEKIPNILDAFYRHKDVHEDDIKWVIRDNGFLVDSLRKNVIMAYLLNKVLEDELVYNSDSDI